MPKGRRGHWTVYPNPNPYQPNATAMGWIDDPNGPDIRYPNPLVKVMLVLCGLFIVGVVFLIGAYFWAQENYVPPNEFVSGSSWQGQEYQYDLSERNPTLFITFDSVDKGDISATVQWPDLNTVTLAQGNIVTHTSDKRWKYVIHPDRTHLQFTHCAGAIYVHFTETTSMKGDNVILNRSYYATVCGGQMSGVWFWPNKPNAGPGGEFTLSKQYNSNQ